MSSLTIQVFSDVICPWCYVGKRRLERALDQLGLRDATSIEWLPFELNPDMPPEGMDRALYRERKFGAERAAGFDNQLAELGREEGIAFAFDRMRRTPSTRRAHMLIAYGMHQGGVTSNALVDGLFRAYFEDGRDIGDPDELVAIAASAGMDPAEARRALDSDNLREFVVSAEGQASKLGIAGVPFFIVDRSWAISGAQPADEWIAALRQRSAGAIPAAAAE